MSTTAALKPAKSGPTWNPFHCGGTALPTQVLLAVKLMAVFWMLDRVGPYAGIVLGHVAPLVAPVALGLWGLLQILGPLAAVLLLFNRAVGVMSLILGSTITIDAVASQAGHRHVFLAVFLILAAHQKRGQAPALMRYGVVFAYLAGGLAWTAGFVQIAWIRWLVRAEPPTVFFDPSALAGVLVLLVIGVSLALPRSRPWAIWAGIVFHIVFPGAFGPFSTWYTVLASYLVFADWPRDRLTVLYDGDCGFCNKTREWISRFDLERLYDWKPYQSGAGAAFGISEEALAQRAYVVSPRGIHSGFQAFRTMALYNPLTYFGLAAIVIAVRGASPVVQNAVLAALILAFSPFVRPIGEMVYDWVARNRHRLPPRDCKIPE